MQDILAKLNADQRAAVLHTEGPLLVLAGAGSGKTRVITVRIAYLVSRGVAPEAILAVTFTNKAAREMRERLAGLIGEERAERVFVGTFHSFCVEVLREHGHAVGLGGKFTISDGSEQLALLRGVLRTLTVEGVEMQAGDLQSRISLLKNKLVEKESYLAKAADEKEELVGRAWGRYEEELARTRSVDFDDLLLRTVQLLKKKDGPLEALRARYRYVLVDEYQDTNAPQYEIVHAIAAKHRNLCVVGDDDQSIYGWRGADVTRILEFEHDYKGAKVVRLLTNYRSTEPILRAANRVISNNTERHAKELVSALGSGDPLQLVMAENESEEADHVARDISSLVTRQLARHGDFAVLFRTGPQARAYEEAFRARGIPYVLIGGKSFFDRKEVRDVIAYLKLLVQPDDELSFSRALDAPPRGVGPKSLERVLAHAARNRLPLAEAFEQAGTIEGVNEAAGAAGRDFCRLMARLREDTAGTLVARTERLLEAVGYRGEVERLYPDPLERTRRWAAVEQVLNVARKYQERKKKPTMEGFLQALTLQEQEGDETEAEERRVVTLMTLHSAKGLEFPRVYLVGLEEGLLPHKRSVQEGTVEEERRLMYVGITRAQRNLTLCLTKARSRFGKGGESLPSRFIFEVKGETPPAEWQKSVRAAARADKRTAALKKAGGKAPVKRKGRRTRPSGAS